MGRVEFELF